LQNAPTFSVECVECECAGCLTSSRPETGDTAASRARLRNTGSVLWVVFTQQECRDVGGVGVDSDQV